MKKCPYCAEEIQDEAIICRYCGRDLGVKETGFPLPTTNSQIPSSEAQPVNPKQSHRTRNIFLVVGGFLVLSCICISIILAVSPQNQETQVTSQAIVANNESTPTKIQPTSSPENTETSAPTNTPIYWDSAQVFSTANPNVYAELLANKKTMTDLQFKDYLDQIVGSRVHFKTTVDEVLEDGALLLSASEGGLFDTIRLEGLPKEIGIKLNKGQTIEFDATIRDFTDFIVFSVTVDEPVLYNVK